MQLAIDGQLLESRRALAWNQSSLNGNYVFPANLVKGTSLVFNNKHGVIDASPLTKKWTAHFEKYVGVDNMMNAFRDGTTAVHFLPHLLYSVFMAHPASPSNKPHTPRLWHQPDNA